MILKAITWLINTALWVVCFIPMPKAIPSPFTRSDLFYHALSYCGVTFLYACAQYPIKWVAILLLLQGIAIEFIQPYFNRFFEGYDIAANTLGILLGLGVYWLYSKYSPWKFTGPAKKTSE